MSSLICDNQKTRLKKLGLKNLTRNSKKNWKNLVKHLQNLPFFAPFLAFFAGKIFCLEEVPFSNFEVDGGSL
jgi:hypothetical protein